MVIELKSAISTEIIYPETDGKPMANNTEQFRWIVVIEQNLEWLFANDPNVFVAGDLFWYPVEGKPHIVNAPDVLTVLGRPKGKRGSYKQWEEDNIPPQVVFEILSPGNTQNEMDRKLVFYDRYGVEEYYIYNPDGNHFKGWLRNDEGLDLIETLDNWVSPSLGIRFDLSAEELQIYHPNGDKFVSYVEIMQRLDAEKKRAEIAETALESEQQRSQLLAERLREMGINPDEL